MITSIKIFRVLKALTITINSLLLCGGIFAAINFPNLPLGLDLIVFGNLLLLLLAVGLSCTIAGFIVGLWLKRKGHLRHRQILPFYIIFALYILCAVLAAFWFMLLISAVSHSCDTGC